MRTKYLMLALLSALIKPCLALNAAPADSSADGPPIIQIIIAVVVLFVIGYVALYVYSNFKED